MINTITVTVDTDAQPACEHVIRYFLTTIGPASVHTLRLQCFTKVKNCRIEDFNAAMVEMMDRCEIKTDGTMFGHALFVMV